MLWLSLGLDKVGGVQKVCSEKVEAFITSRISFDRSFSPILYAFSIGVCLRFGAGKCSQPPGEEHPMRSLAAIAKEWVLQGASRGCQTN